jgi:hypothetical protein
VSSISRDHWRKRIITKGVRFETQKARMETYSPEKGALDSENLADIIVRYTPDRPFLGMENSHAVQG